MLIDNGSALKTCHVMILGRIGIEDTSMHCNGKMVHAFDSTNTATPGDMDLKVSIEPCEFEIPLVVVDILAVLTYSFADFGFKLQVLSLPASTRK